MPEKREQRYRQAKARVLELGLYVILGLLLLSLFAIAWSVHDRMQAEALRSKGIAVNGTITGIEGKPGALTFAVRFTTHTGETIEASGLTPPDTMVFYAVGDEVPLIYNPENPSEVRMGPRANLPDPSSFALAASLIMLLCTCFAVWGLTYRLKEMRLRSQAPSKHRRQRRSVRHRFQPRK